MKEWDTEIIDELSRVCNKTQDLNEFVNKYWERFKPTYIHIFKYIESDGDLYMLVYKFFSKIVRSDVQPLFQSDNQLFNYFKISAKNEKYDIEHKKEIQCIPFSELESSEDSDMDYSVEDFIADDSTSFEDIVSGEMIVRSILDELSKVLSESYIQVIILLYKGYNLKEIRKVLGISYATVNDRLWVIRNTLKEKFGITDKNLSWDKEKDNIYNSN